VRAAGQDAATGPLAGRFPKHGPLSHLPARSFRPHHGRVFRRVRIGHRGDARGSHTPGTVSRGRSLEEQQLHRPPERPGSAALGPVAGRLDGVQLAGDVLMVTRLDRLARSTRDLLNTLAARSQAARLVSARLAPHGPTPRRRTGQLMLTVLGGLAEFERDLIRTRTGEGRARAVARGQKMGRPPKLTSHQQREAIKRHDRVGNRSLTLAAATTSAGRRVSRLTPGSHAGRSYVRRLSPGPARNRQLIVPSGRTSGPLSCHGSRSASYR
jgi:Resolvase, N terminal domain